MNFSRIAFLKFSFTLPEMDAVIVVEIFNVEI